MCVCVCVCVCVLRAGSIEFSNDVRFDLQPVGLYSGSRPFFLSSNAGFRAPSVYTKSVYISRGYRIPMHVHSSSVITFEAATPRPATNFSLPPVGYCVLISPLRPRDPSRRSFENHPRYLLFLLENHAPVRFPYSRAHKLLPSSPPHPSTICFFDNAEKKLSLSLSLLSSSENRN